MDHHESCHTQPRVDINTGPSFTELLDNHRTTSRLLVESQEEQKSKHSSGISVPDDCSVSILEVDSEGTFGGDEPGASSCPDSDVVFWWPPFTALFWELWGILLPGCFLALGACVASLKDTPESIWSARVIQATRIAPSVWPVIFSGIIGNAIRALADWRVERGVSLLALEQLLGSLTMAGSVTTTLRWSIVRLSTLALILLWAFNPLGSQASFRGIALQPREDISQALVTFNNANLTSQLRVTSFAEPLLRPMKPTLHALYSSSLYDIYSSIQYVDPINEVRQKIVAVLGGETSAGLQAANDRWGNVRIPNLKYLSSYDSASPQGWLETSWDKTVLNYSSLLGDRVNGLNRNTTGNTTFTIMSSYQDFECSPWQTLMSDPMTSNTSEADTWLLRYTRRRCENYWSAKDSVIARTTSRTFFVSLVSENLTALPDTPELIFGTRINRWMIGVTKCTSRTVVVDANVTCVFKGTLSKGSCGVSALRESPQGDHTSVLAHRNTSAIGFDVFMDLLDDNLPDVETSSDTESYLYNPLTAFTNRRITTPEYTDLSTLDIRTFEQRFSLLWNTLWKASWMRQDAMGGSMGAAVSEDSDLLNATAIVTSVLPPTYEINRPWLAIYFISVFVMFFAAVFAMVMRYLCRAPAILGYASSLIRDSPYFEERGVCGNSAEDGIHKSRRLGDLKVMVANVNVSGKGAGKIAFAPAGVGKKVKRGKWYI